MPHRSTNRTKGNNVSDTHLPPRMLQDIKECFILFSQDSQTIPLESLEKFLHTLGIAPSQAELRDLENELRDGHRTEISRPHIIQIVKQRIANHHRSVTGGLLEGFSASPAVDNTTTTGKKHKKSATSRQLSRQQLQEYWGKELKEAFEIFDANENGRISKDEWAAVMKRLGENFSQEEISALMMEVDLDRDGKVSFSDFKKFMGF